MKRKRVSVVLALFISGMLVLSLPTTMFANASGTLSVQPAEGEAGILVTVTGGGFSGRTAVYLNGTRVTTATASSTYGNIQASFHVPDVPAGTYNVTASDEGGNTAQTTFTVTGSDASPSPSASSSATPTPEPSTSAHSSTSPSGSSTPHKTYHPTTSPAANVFSSPLVIGGIVAAAAAVAVVLIAFMLRARGKPKPSQSSFDSEPPMPYRPQPPPPTNPLSSRTTPTTVASRYTSSSTYGSSAYGQSSRPVTSNRPAYSSPSYSQTPSFGTKTCPHCRRSIRVDYNICPYCYKRVK